MTILKWLTRKTYNRFDPIWIGLAALAMRDQEWFPLAVFVLVGIVISSALEALEKRTRRNKETS